MLKESNPMQTAVFVIAQVINNMHVFHWLVKHVLKKNRIIASIKKQQTIYLKKSHKFGIELPKAVEQVYALDAKNSNTLWADALSKELENDRVTFKVLPDGKPLPTGHKTMPCNVVFLYSSPNFFGLLVDALCLHSLP